MRFLAANWRRERDSNPCGRVPKRFSRPPRYDHFDIPPYMNCRSADIIGYSIFLEIFLEMLFSVSFGVPEKSVFTRLFCVFATVMLANFQDRLVMTASITLRVNYLIVLFLLFFSPLEFSIEIILGKYFTVLKTACFEPLLEFSILHHRAAG